MKKTHAPLPPLKVNKSNKKISNNKKVTKVKKKKIVPPSPFKSTKK